MENYTVKKLIGRDKIKMRVREIAAEIDRDYKDKNPIFAVVLKGGFIFAADLLRSLKIPTSLDFIGTSSYEGTKSSGDVRITKDLDYTIKGRHLLLVEDIVDTGLTLNNLIKLLKQRGPKSLNIASLLVKDIPRNFEIPLRYVCFNIPNKFVIGCGLDFDEKHRGLPYIGYVEPVAKK